MFVSKKINKINKKNTGKKQGITLGEKRKKVNEMIQQELRKRNSPKALK